MPRVVGPATVLLALIVWMLWYANTKNDEAQAAMPPPPVPASGTPLVGPPVPEPRSNALGASTWHTRDGGPATGIDLETDLDSRLAQHLAVLDPTKERAVYRLLESLGAGRVEPDGDQFRAVVASLLRLRERSADPRVRRGALAVLARAPDCPTLVEPFLIAFCDADPRVRREAVLGRARRGAGQYTRFIVPLVRDVDPGVRAAAAQALAGNRQIEAQEALQRLFTDTNDDVVDMASRALASGISETPAPVVMAAVRSDRHRVRVAAARVLGEAHTPECLAPLTELASDPVWDVRREAIRQLQRFGGASAAVACARLQATALDPQATRTDRYEALQALALTEMAPNLDDLAGVATHDPDPVLRLVAARTLLARHDARACAVVVALTAVEIGPRCDFEDRKFVQGTAKATIRDVTAAAVADEDEGGWRRLQSSFEARVRVSGFSWQATPLPERW